MERMTIRDAEGTYFITPMGNALPAPELRLATVQVLLDSLATYEDAEEQGLLVRLPCKFGETCYEIIRGEVVEHNFIKADFPFFHKIYSSREEAEAALAKEG